MTLLYEDFEAEDMDNFLDHSGIHEPMEYFHSFDGYMYATDGKKAIRCKTKLPDGVYSPHTYESLHSSAVTVKFWGIKIADQFKPFDDQEVKVKTVDLHDIKLEESTGFNVVMLNIVDDIWFNFYHLSCCLTGDGSDFKFHYTTRDKAIYIKEEVYEFVCMPYANMK